MAVSNGPWENHGRIEWDYGVPQSAQGVESIIPIAYAYFRAEVGWDQYYNGSIAWSGVWGSGSQGQAFNLDRTGPRILLVGGGNAVSLTDAPKTVSFGVAAHHYFGSTYSTLSVTVPGRFAITPTDLTVTRVSDTQQTLTWTRKSEYTGVVVHRSTDGGPWQEIGRPTGNVATFTDTTTEANRKYEYRVAGLNSRASGGIGQSAWSATVTIFTSPAAPASASADRDGNDILVTAAGLPQHATSFDIEDSGSVVQTGAVLPWRHAAPSPTIPHTYRVRGVVGGVAGAWSPPSKTVQLITKPNPPVNLTPNGGVAASDGPVRLEFTHNPVDTSAQTAYELRHRLPPAGAWTTLSGTTASFRDVTLPVGAREWQVRTKGAHADWSDWSAIATVTVINRPGVAITQPGPAWEASILTGKWSYLQAQGRPQSGWEVELLDGTGAVVEARSGSGATAEVVFSTRLTEGSWSVRARAATGTVWSAWALTVFTVEFFPPDMPLISGSWDESAGGVALSIAPGTDTGAPETVKLMLERSIDGGALWEPMLTLEQPDLMNLMDWESPSRGTTLYRLTAYTVEGAISEVALPVVATSQAVWLSGDTGFALACRLPFDPKPSITPGRARASKRYAGRALPVAYAGEAISRTVQVSGTTTDHALSDEESAHVERLTMLAQTPAPVFMFRDPDGRRIYGTIGDIPMPREAASPHESGWNGIWGYSFTLEESGRS